MASFMGVGADLYNHAMTIDVNVPKLPQVDGEPTIRTHLQLLTEREVARLLKVSISALRKWRRESTGPKFCKIQRCVRYNAEQLRGWLEAQNKEATFRKGGTR